jgi:hypothetical protein
MRRWLLQRFQQCVGRADRHAVSVVDQTDFSFADEWTIHDLVLDLADLLNFYLLSGLFLVRLDDEKVRVREGLDLLAGPAGAATIETVRFRGPFAVERLGKANGRQSFPDCLLAVEQIGVSQSLMGDGGL